MCGRYTLRFPRKVTDVFLPSFASVGVGPRYNIAPGQQVLVIRSSQDIKDGSDPEVVFLEWGWPPPSGVKGAVINARAEKVASSLFFKEAIHGRRCLLPADGFYEWEKVKERRLPYYFALRDDRPFALAALWTQDAEGAERVIVITVPANSLVARVHPRMPAILSRDSALAWIRPSLDGMESALKLLTPFPAEEMQMLRVSSRVNSSKVDDPGCVEPETTRLEPEQLDWDFK